MKPIRLEVNPKTTMSDITHFLNQINMEDGSIGANLKLFSDYSCQVEITSAEKTVDCNWKEGYIEYTPEYVE